jgi:hypothetical protein
MAAEPRIDKARLKRPLALPKRGMRAKAGRATIETDIGALAPSSSDSTSRWPTGSFNAKPEATRTIGGVIAGH